MNCVWATQKNLSDIRPVLSPDKVCGRFLTYPSNNKLDEGGLRLKNVFKANIIGKPLVSIITVVFNRDDKLERALQTILNQTYDNIEYIIIDGGSTDKTLDIIKKYESAIDYFISEPDCGIYDAMNKGLQLAHGEIIGILNSDDWFSNDAVKLSVESIINSQADYSGADEVLVEEDGSTMGNYGLFYFDDVAFFALNPCNHGTMFINRKIYDAIGLYDTTLKIASDLKFQLQIVARQYKPCVIHQPIHYYEVSGISSTNQQRAISEVSFLLKEYHPNLTEQEVEAIAKLRYYEEISSVTFQLLDKVAISKDYTIPQKYFLIHRMSEIADKYNYLFYNKQSQETIEMVGIKESFLMLLKAIKRKLVKTLRGTTIFMPARRLYHWVKRI